jgi:hypothetical protein
MAANGATAYQDKALTHQGRHTFFVSCKDEIEIGPSARYSFNFCV